MSEGVLQRPRMTIDGKTREHVNLASIRRYVAEHVPQAVLISNGPHYTGKLELQFFGAYYVAEFASFSVMLQWVRRWRAVYGVPLRLNGEPAGVVEWDTEVLKP